MELTETVNELTETVNELTETELKMIFKNYTIKTPRFSLNGLKTYGRLVDIIDGDSLTIILPVHNTYYKFNVRLNGIDASEIHSHDDYLKQNALKTRNEIFKLITNMEQKKIDKIYTKEEIKDILEKELTLVWVECLEFDKYGRLLAEIYISKEKSISLSKYLLENNLVYKYNGGTKLNEIAQIIELKK